MFLLPDKLVGKIIVECLKHLINMGINKDRRICMEIFLDGLVCARLEWSG